MGELELAVVEPDENIDFILAEASKEPAVVGVTEGSVDAIEFLLANVEPATGSVVAAAGFDKPSDPNASGDPEPESE